MDRNKPTERTCLVLLNVVVVRLFWKKSTTTSYYEEEIRRAMSGIGVDVKDVNNPSRTVDTTMDGLCCEWSVLHIILCRMFLTQQVLSLMRHVAEEAGTCPVLFSLSFPTKAEVHMTWNTFDKSTGSPGRWKIFSKSSKKQCPVRSWRCYH